MTSSTVLAQLRTWKKGADSSRVFHRISPSGYEPSAPWCRGILKSSLQNQHHLWRLTLRVLMEMIFPWTAKWVLDWLTSSNVTGWWSMQDSDFGNANLKRRWNETVGGMVYFQDLLNDPEVDKLLRWPRMRVNESFEFLSDIFGRTRALSLTHVSSHHI